MGTQMASRMGSQPPRNSPDPEELPLPPAGWPGQQDHEPPLGTPDFPALSP